MAHIVVSIEVYCDCGEEITNEVEFDCRDMEYKERNYIEIIAGKCSECLRKEGDEVSDYE